MLPGVFVLPLPITRPLPPVLSGPKTKLFTNQTTMQIAIHYRINLLPFQFLVIPLAQFDISFSMPLTFL